MLFHAKKEEYLSEWWEKNNGNYEKRKITWTNEIIFALGKSKQKQLNTNLGSVMSHKISYLINRNLPVQLHTLVTVIHVSSISTQSAAIKTMYNTMKQASIVWNYTALASFISVQVSGCRGPRDLTCRERVVRGYEAVGFRWPALDWNTQPVTAHSHLAKCPALYLGSLTSNSSQSRERTVNTWTRRARVTRNSD